MKIEIIKYKCDVCGKEFDLKGGIKKETVPCYSEGMYHTSAMIDLCDDCASRLRKVIFDNFAEIRDCYGITIKKKF